MVFTVEGQAVFGDHVHDHLEGLAGVCDVVNDQDSLAFHRGNIHERRKQNRCFEGFANAGVELDVHGATCFDVHCVGDGTRGDQATARDGDDQFGDPAGVNNLLSEFTACNAETFPRENLAICNVGNVRGLSSGGVRLIRHVTP